MLELSAQSLDIDPGVCTTGRQDYPFHTVRQIAVWTTAGARKMRSAHCTREAVIRELMSVLMLLSAPSNPVVMGVFPTQV